MPKALQYEQDKSYSNPMHIFQLRVGTLHTAGVAIQITYVASDAR
jgi:hypothetical protein